MFQTTNQTIVLLIHLIQFLPILVESMIAETHRHQSGESVSLHQEGSLQLVDRDSKRFLMELVLMSSVPLKRASQEKI